MEGNEAVIGVCIFGLGARLDETKFQPLVGAFSWQRGKAFPARTSVIYYWLGMSQKFV